MDVMGVQVPLRVRLDVMSKQSQLIWGVQISHLVNAARRKKKLSRVWSRVRSSINIHSR